MLPIRTCCRGMGEQVHPSVLTASTKLGLRRRAIELHAKSLLPSPSHYRLIGDSVRGNKQQKPIWYQRIASDPQLGASLMLIANQTAFRFLNACKYGGFLQHTLAVVETTIRSGVGWIHSAKRGRPLIDPVRISRNSH
jgi:hypothetical protein